MFRTAGSGHQATEWRMTDDDNGRESIVELARIVGSYSSQPLSRVILMLVLPLLLSHVWSESEPVANRPPKCFWHVIRLPVTL